jgi:hypothetical protein
MKSEFLYMRFKNDEVNFTGQTINGINFGVPGRSYAFDRQDERMDHSRRRQLPLGRRKVIRVGAAPTLLIHYCRGFGRGFFFDPQCMTTPDGLTM